MKKIIGFFFLFISGLTWQGWAASYYVSSSSGSDGNPGTQGQPFQTLAKVNGLGLAAGDSVYLKRGDTWNEQLIPPSSGSSGNPITFDAYGTGEAPVLTPRINLAGATWTHNSGNIYTTTLSTTISSPKINNLQLGSIWGKRRDANPGCASAGVITGYGDFCVVYPTLYLYSPNGTLPSAYYGSIVPVVGQASGLAVISIVNKNWLVFQHIKIQNFDYMGVSVTGTSDNLVLANMESDGMVPYGTTPHGFYVNAAGASNIQFLDDDAHLNYDGFHFDAATAITVTNCRGYANRDNGLKDNSGHATYSYSHFYGNNVAQLAANDIVGGIAGAGNIASTIAPLVSNFNTYPARFSFTVDDVGSSAGTEAYINDLLSTFSSRGLQFNAAVVPSYTVDWTSVNRWYGSGNEIDSHSWSHQYYTTNTNPQNSPPYPNAPALDIRYTGSGTAATLTISGNVLSTNVTGAAGDNISVNLTDAAYDTMAELKSYLSGMAHYSVTYDASGPNVRPNTHSANLASVANVDVKSAVTVLLYDQTKLVPDELMASKNEIESKVPGLSEIFLVYPDGIEDFTVEMDAVAAGYRGARGSLAMKGQDNTTASANSLYSNGVNVQNITSLGAAQIHGMSQTQINQMAANLIFRAAAWGVPYGLFTHYNSAGDGTPDISNVELAWLLDAVTANGGMWMTNTALATAMMSGNVVSGTTRYVQNPSGAGVDLKIRAANSPTTGVGVATAYPIDLNGVDRRLLGAWDVGASTYLSQRYGTGAGGGNTYVGGVPGLAAVQLPNLWVNNEEGYEALSLADYSTTFPASGTGGNWFCGDTQFGPYTAGSQDSLNHLLEDAEACRTANGGTPNIILYIPPGLYSGASGVTIPQSSNTAATGFIAVISTQDISLADGRTVCAGGMQDNLASSSDPGLNNPDCTGKNMYYALGPQNSGGVVTGITTLSVNTTTLAAVATTGSQCVALKNDYVAPGIGVTVDTGANQETVTTTSAVNQNGMCGNFTKTHAAGVPVTYDAGNFTLANGTQTKTSNYNDVQYMWTVECSGNGCVPLDFCSPMASGSGACASASLAPDHWVFQDLEVRIQSGQTTNQMLISMGANGETATSQLPNHIHFRKTWAHGDWTSLLAGTNSISTAFGMQCVSCSVMDSQTSQALRPGAEGHAMGGNGTNLKLVHNWLEGQSSCIFSGGYSSVNGPSIPGFVPFQDVEMRRNRCTFPYTWLGVMKVPAGGNATWANQSLVRKNCQENKEMERVVRDGNICENVDNSGGQSGTVTVINVRNTSAGSTGKNYQSTINDVTYTNEIDRNACEGIEMAGRSASGVGNGGGTSNPIRRFLIGNTLEYGITNTNPGCTGTGKFGIQMNAASQHWRGTVVEDATGRFATFTATCSVDGDDCPAGPPGVGFEVFDMAPGDPVSITGCTDSNFNVPTRTLNGHTVAVGVGPLATSATNPMSLTVVYPWTAPANESDTTGTCELVNGQGAPQNVTIDHHTLITDANQAIGNGASATSGPNFQMNHVFQNSIILNSGANGAGWYNSVVGEGTATQTYNYDASSMTANYLVWPTRTASKYTEYSNAPGKSGNCKGSGCNPPLTMYFPATSYCTGAVPSSSCVGFSGAMNTSAMPLTLPDYHGFQLMAGSTFKAGGPGDASDGTDMGVNLGAIDAAQTLNQYVCGASCGKGGPYPDAAVPVSPNFFGVHYNQTTTPFPTSGYSFPIVRLWDTATGWADLQTNANCTNTVTSGCNFGKLDTWLNKFGTGEQVILTLGKVPNFIASNPSDVNCGYGANLGNPNGSCTPPTDLNCDGTGTNATWIQFLTALWNHLKSTGTAKQISYLEIWNEYNVSTFWDSGYINGTRCSGYSDPVQKMLIRLTQDAQCVTQGKNCNANGTYPQTAMNPGTRMMSPPVNGPASGNQPYNSGGMMYKLLANGIANYVDVISTHGYVTTSTTCAAPLNATCAVPEAMDSALDVLQSDMKTFAISKPVMISEFSWGSTTGTNDPQYEQAFVSRYYTLAAQKGVVSANWYYLSTGSNDCTIGPILQQQNGTVCPTGTAMGVIQDWLNGATFLQRTYTKTPRNDCAAGSNIYEFPILRANGSLARIVYYDGMANTARCSYTLPRLGFHHHRDMTGAITTLDGDRDEDDVIMLDNRAILLTVE